MKIGVTFGRVLSYAWKNFTRNAWIGLTTIFVLILAILSVNVLVGVNALVNRSIEVLEERIDLSVFFKVDTPEAVMEQARFFMASLPQVRDVTLLDPEESLQQFRDVHFDDPEIIAALDELEENPLGASLIIQAKRTEDYPFLLEALQNPQFDFAIESKTYDDHAEAIARVRDIGKSARLFGIVLIAIFAIFSVLIVYNTVRVAIYTQREEIGIMRLVGASGAFVRSPLVVQSLFLALFALGVSAAIIAAIIVTVEPRLASFFGGSSPGLQAYYVNNLPSIIAIQAGGLLVIVALSSWAAVGKYLKR